MADGRAPGSSTRAAKHTWVGELVKYEVVARVACDDLQAGSFVGRRPDTARSCPVPRDAFGSGVGRVDPERASEPAIQPHHPPAPGPRLELGALAPTF
jgi:hypothetical protein